MFNTFNDFISKQQTFILFQALGKSLVKLHTHMRCSNNMNDHAQTWTLIHCSYSLNTESPLKVGDEKCKARNIQ